MGADYPLCMPNPSCRNVLANIFITFNYRQFTDFVNTPAVMVYSSMQEIFQLLAEYNRTTDREMLGILGAQPSELLSRPAGAYHGSILGVLNHLLQADVIWLRRFAHQLPELGPVAKELPDFKLRSLKEVVWDSLAVFQPVREKTDELLERAVQAIPPARYPEFLEYRNIKGEPQRKVLWRTLLHVFNHQTHHRGQVAALLDQFGVENDYSNLIWKF
jgi:uncharacterized damage-inducible protein DinB